MSTEKRAFSVSWASLNRQKCPDIVLKFTKKIGPEISLLAPGSPDIGDLLPWLFVPTYLLSHFMVLNVVNVFLMRNDMPSFSAELFDEKGRRWENWE